VSALDNRLNLPLLHRNNKKAAKVFKLSTLSPWATHSALSAWHYCYHTTHTHIEVLMWQRLPGVRKRSMMDTV